MAKIMKRIGRQLTEIRLLPDRVHQRQPHFRIIDPQRDARESTTCAEVENLCARAETEYLGYCHRVKHMVFVEVVDVLTGDDVDLLVPVAIEGIEGLNLLTLLRRQVGEVFTDERLHG